MNHRIKRALFKTYPLICFAVFVAAILLFTWGVLGWKEFAGTASGVFWFAFSVQKQNLAEIELFKRLFEQFNERYDKLDKELIRICFDEQPLDKPFTDDERDTLYKYFNLCGEEWLYAKKGFICEEVWTAWENGMKFFRKNPRIKKLWDEDLNDNESYYGLTF